MEEVCPRKTASSTGESFCKAMFTVDETSIVAETRDSRDNGGRDRCIVNALEMDTANGYEFKG